MQDDFAFCTATAENAGGRIAFKDTVENEWPHSWPDGEISYRLNNLSPDFNGDLQLRAVTVALRAWQLRINKLKFRRERNPDVNVDFQVSFKPSSAFSSKHVFAHAWYPNQGEISGDVEINDEDWNWVPSIHLQDLRSPPLTAVMIHEFGHSLGLAHDTSTSDSIMYPSFNLGRKRILLHQNDIDRIQDRYGVRNLSQRWLDYFMNRRLRSWDFE